MKRWPKVVRVAKTKQYMQEVVIDIKQLNLLFKSDNLKVLKVLQSTHASTVKCIYVDPPYNTGINRKHFMDNRNSSDWGQMMRERLEVLKTLLREDGSIWISIDDTSFAILEKFAIKCLALTIF